MSPSVRWFVIWGPRLLGLAVAAFLGLFALDAFDARSPAAALSSFGVHLLPALIVGLVVGAGWRFPWLGAAGFGVLAAGYAAMVPHRPDWILVIAGPLALVAVLFALNAVWAGSSPPTISRARTNRAARN